MKDVFDVANVVIHIINNIVHKTPWFITRQFATYRSERVLLKFWSIHSTINFDFLYFISNKRSGSADIHFIITTDCVMGFVVVL